MEGTQPVTKTMSQKRIRRRTVPALPPKVTPRIPPKLPRSPLQVLEANLRHFVDIVISIGGRTFLTKPEDLLSDVLFSVNSIMGLDVGGTWSVDAPAGGNEPTSVTLGQVRSHLKEVFQVTEERLQEILEGVQKREAANVTLTLKVIEASNLRPKTVRGASNPYVTVSIPGTTETHRTRTEHETLFPKWRQEFKLKVKNLNRDTVKLDVWHDLETGVSNQVLAVKDLKGLSRLVKGKTAIAHKQEAHLLGTVSVPLKSIRENGLNEWFPLFKESQKEEDKSRGFLHIEGYVTAASQQFDPEEARRSHDSLLARLIFHHLKNVSNNNSEEIAFMIPWQGKLPPEASAAVAQHAIILGLGPAVQQLSWWIVGSRVPSADAAWQMNLLKAVQHHLSIGSYDITDLESLADSFSFWIDCSLGRLRNLRKSFPSSSAIIAKSQFATVLSLFNLLESHKQSNSLLERKEIKGLRGEVRKAVIQHMEIWWTQLIEEHLKDEMRPEAQIQKIILITSEAYNFLSNVATFYSPTLLREMGIPYFRETFILITKKINPCVRPPLMNIYNHLCDVNSAPAIIDDDRNAPTYTLEDGTSLWQLYVNLGKINRLGQDLPLEVRKESGIYEYHKWFNRGVRRWVELARNRALRMVEKAVDFDNFEPVDEYCNFSSSATDVSGIITDVQIWWRNLEWPDPENSMILLTRILEDVCSYGMKYADLLKQKVEAMFNVQSFSDQLVISKQICTGLNNIEKIRYELTRLQDTFSIKTLIDNVKKSQTGGEEVAVRFQSNINKLIESSSENMEGKVYEFIEAVVQKMSGTLNHAVVQACEASNEKPLLLEVLDPALHLLRNKMSVGNFKRFLQILWEQLIELFHLTVTRNTDKRKASFFQGIFVILKACLKFFCPPDSDGLDEDEAKTQEYLDLVELLECLRLSSENLISKYYSERVEEQKLSSNLSRGELVVRAYFTKVGKLTVEVIMAKDMQVHHETGSLASKHSQFGAQNQQIDAFVKVQLVPLEWFPQADAVRTKTMRRCDPAVFEETFDFDVGNEDNGVSSGFLLFTLKDYYLARSNAFIGEAAIPMSELECVDSSCVHNVSNTYLRLTHPGMEFGYPSLRALRLRHNDRVATAFLKKLQARLPDARTRPGGAGAGGGALSSDEDKPRPRSPRLLQKIGLS